MEIRKVSPFDWEAVQLMQELTDCLEAITGNGGQASFDPEDVCIPRSLFVIAYDETGEALGCGAIRPMEDSIAEVKRMFARTKVSGVGSQILHYLENQAKDFGYTMLRLETRMINTTAVSFYEKRGYTRIPNYGKYVDRPEAVCFEKNL